MRTLSQVSSNSAKYRTITAEENSINYISIDDLKKYLEIADKFLSSESKQVIQYLIVNNSTYITDLSSDTEENVIVGFYNSKRPTDEKLSTLWDLLHTIGKTGRILEIPTLQSKEHFESIINKQVPADRIILRIDNAQARNEIVIMYDPLVHKMCRQWMGKSTLTYDDLYSAAQVGLIWAMNNYGIKKAKRKIKGADDEVPEEVKEVNIKQTFGQYAAYMIMYSIINSIRTESHIVSIPVNKQQEEKQLTGKNVKNRSISGDKKVGINNSDDGNKTVFDFIEDGDSASRSLENEDIANIWKEIWAECEKEFDKKIMQSFYSFHGLNGYEKLKNKEIAQKYGVSNSLVTYYCVKVEKYIQTNKKIMELLKEVYKLMNECLSIDDTRNNILFEPLYIK